MIEIFAVDIQRKGQAAAVLQILCECFPHLEINVDLSGTNREFPCGHSILRIEGSIISTDEIVTQVGKAGYRCKILEDRVCI